MIQNIANQYIIPILSNAYISKFPLEVQAILKEIQRIVEETAPGAEAGFAYGMPAYKLNGKPLIYFAAYKNHIGLYATPNAHAHFSQELSAYKQGKGSVQFPLAQPMPFGLIRRIVAFNAKNLC